MPLALSIRRLDIRYKLASSFRRQSLFARTSCRLGLSELMSNQLFQLPASHTLLQGPPLVTAETALYLILTVKRLPRIHIRDMISAAEFIACLLWESKKSPEWRHYEQLVDDPDPENNC